MQSRRTQFDKDSIFNIEITPVKDLVHFINFGLLPRFFLRLALLFTNVIFAGDSISSNPAAVNITTGTGTLGEHLGFSKDSGVRLGGLLVEDINYLFCGGVEPRKWSGNSLFILDFFLDTDKLKWWEGGSFGAEFLQFNGRPTNNEAGSVQGYNSLPATPPFDRSELYQIWFRQEFFCKKLIVRVGKSVPSYDFNNVVRPLQLGDKNFSIPATNSLIYTPIFINSALLGVLPGYYDSAYGITLTYAPKADKYLNYGIYDGNLARNKHTGLRGPQFNSYRFQIIEFGYAWGAKSYPGDLGIGGWNQSGKLAASNGVLEHGASGLYLFCSQRLWWQHFEKDNSGINAFVQAGINDSKTLPITLYGGAGLTFLGLVPNRIDDSFGVGMALGRLNHRQFTRSKELILQGYYQAKLFGDSYFLSAISYIPNPGLAEDLKPVIAGTARIILLF